MLKQFDFRGINSEAEDGTRTVTITVAGLSEDEASRLLSALYAPVRKTAIDVLAGGVDFTTMARDLTKATQ